MKLGWLLSLAPLFTLLGIWAGIPDLGQQWKDVVPHLEAVIAFVLVLSQVFGGVRLMRYLPKDAMERLFRDKTGN